MDTKSIQNELTNTLTAFVNEIDLIFDYINKDSIGKWKRQITAIESASTDDSVEANVINEFVIKTLQQLQPHETAISSIVLATTKIRRSAYDFLDNVSLFSDDCPLHFSVFRDENKNTKLTIVKYIYNIYMTSYLLHFGIDNTSTKQFIDYLNSLKSKLAKVKNTATNVATVDTNVDDFDFVLPKNVPTVPSGPDVSNLGNLFESLMGNREIMTIAEDLSKDIQNENLDPMSLLSSLMSGKPDSTIQRLVTNISGKIEAKIQNGEIDKDLLERQTQSILKNVSTENIDKVFK